MASPFRTSNIHLCCLLFLAAVSGSKAQQQPKVTGFFTDMHYIQQAGDVLGSEIWIVYARGGFWATVQMAEGEPDPPVIVPVEVSGVRVKFTIKEPRVDQNGKPAPEFVMQFDGIMTRSGFDGTINSQPLRLKRGNSYWQ
jgi:hypothetical protein